MKSLVENAHYIEVSAEVRYWEDASINGVEDGDGTLIPFRDGDLWRPVIRLSDGVVLNWPAGVEADIHYKVCDQGEYWLLDDRHRRIAKYRSHYVPDGFLCHGDTGDGDYIIFVVQPDGRIAGWTPPVIEADQWQPIAPDAQSLLSPQSGATSC